MGCSSNKTAPPLLRGGWPIRPRENEFVTDSETARLAGWHLNETIPFGAFTLAQAATGDSTIKAHLRFAAKLVGICRVQQSCGCP